MRSDWCDETAYGSDGRKMMALTDTDVEKIRPGFLVTADWLRSEKACSVQRGLFKARYPDGMKITTRNLNIARSKHRLNVRWLIETILFYDERHRLQEYTNANPRVHVWTLKNARLFHSAFLKILGER